MTSGTLGILNIGAGDTKLSFDPDNPKERAMSAAIVTDMLKRGFVIFIEVYHPNGTVTNQRVLSFREDVCEYIIADMAAPVEQSLGEQADEPSREKTSRKRDATGGQTKRKVGRPRKSVDAGSVRGVAVARSAGG